VTKPFSLVELLERVHALLRRGTRGVSNGQPALLAFGDVAVDEASRTVTRSGAPVTLPPKAFDLLLALARREGRVANRVELLREVWGYNYTGGTRTVDVHVRRLREKLPLLVDGLVTVKQFGYKLSDQRGQATEA